MFLKDRKNGSNDDKQTKSNNPIVGAILEKENAAIRTATPVIPRKKIIGNLFVKRSKTKKLNIKINKIRIA
ncbi:hypothetical protein PDA01_18020 [Pediococcus damnosus]|nr:hypothetical protein PDA01_18020 [Pediococcus damnosus]